MPVLHDRDTMTVREGRTTSRWKPRRMSERTMCFHPVWDRNGVHLGDTRLRWRSVGPEVSTQTWVLSGSQRRLQRRQRSTTPADDGDCRESWFVLQPILHRWLCRLQLFIDHKLERAPIKLEGNIQWCLTLSLQAPSGVRTRSGTTARTSRPSAGTLVTSTST